METGKRKLRSIDDFRAKSLIQSLSCCKSRRVPIDGIANRVMLLPRRMEAVPIAKGKEKRKRVPKHVLKLPDLEQSKSAVLNSLTSRSSQRTYDHAIREFIEWYCSEPRLAFNKTVVTRYRISLEQRHYASTTINLRLAAVRRLAYEAADCGLLSAHLAAGIRRVKGAKRLGVPVGNWLSAEQGKRLLSTACSASLRGKRDYATLAILLGCGLRRAELTALRVEDIQQREEHWSSPTLSARAATYEPSRFRTG